MNIIEPYAHVLEPQTREGGVVLLRKIEAYGRVSHRSEEAQTPDSWERFIRSVVLNHGDWSIVEHCSATVEAVVDRGVTHEWVRHRVGSYTQESTRFVNYEKKMPPAFIEPNWESLLNDNTSDPSLSRADRMRRAKERWRVAMSGCEEIYRQLLSLGCAPQIARSVFPNALASKLVVTYNLRNWRHFFIMRTSKEAHPQMKEVTVPLLARFKELIPILFEDIEPERRQAEAMRLTR